MSDNQKKRCNNYFSSFDDDLELINRLENKFKRLKDMHGDKIMQISAGRFPAEVGGDGSSNTWKCRCKDIAMSQVEPEKPNTKEEDDNDQEILQRLASIRHRLNKITSTLREKNQNMVKTIMDEHEQDQGQDN